MTGSLLFLSLSLFVGVSCAYPLMEETPRSGDVQLAFSPTSYASSSSLVSINVDNFNGFANVLYSDVDFSQYGDSQLYYLNDNGLLHESFSNTPRFNFVVNRLKSLNAYCGFFVGFDTDEVSITPYWRLYDFGNYGLNNTFYWLLDDSMTSDGLNSYDFMTCGYSYSLDGGFGYKYTQSISLFGNDSIDNHYVSLDFTDKLYVGGQFTIDYVFDTTDSHPLISFLIGMENSSSSYVDGYNAGYNNGYEEGSTAGYIEGKSVGNTEGYANGYSDGLASASQGSFNTLFGAIADTPIIFLRSLFNFDLFGMNVFVIIMSLITGIIIIYVIKKVWK